VSQENIELVKRGYSAFARGDLQGVIDVLGPDLEMTDPFGFSTTDTYQGHGGFIETVHDALESFERYEITADDFIDAGDDVVVSVRINGIGRGSGAIVNMRVFHVWTIRDGKATIGRAFPTKEAAFQAAALSNP